RSRRHLYRMRYPIHILNRDAARSHRHGGKISYSLFVRHRTKEGFPSPGTQLTTAAVSHASLIDVRLVVNPFVTQAIAFRVDAPRQPLVRVFLKLVGTRLVRHTLH